MGQCLNGGLLRIIEVYDIKIGIHSKLNAYREIYMYQKLRLFLELDKQHRVPKAFK